MVYMYHSFLIHSSADGHLGCFHVLAIMNREALIKKILIKTNKKKNILLNGQHICLFTLKNLKNKKPKEKKEVLKHDVSKGSDYLS